MPIVNFYGRPVLGERLATPEDQFRDGRVYVLLSVGFGKCCWSWTCASSLSMRLSAHSGGFGNDWVLMVADEWKLLVG